MCGLLADQSPALRLGLRLFRDRWLYGGYMKPRNNKAPQSLRGFDWNQMVPVKGIEPSTFSLRMTILANSTPFASVELS